ncbi:ABC transporter permease [Pedobacter caeni]|uniref:Lipoprotein-releasing system permease protein n=1 Tax=Pedobacter caeni TaxID=288992 RepID=A0A1M5HUV4_9SPHI|nr:ABC transporter permease [Pedobacter caeni]SHG19677.1 lipoprotein-releasing system permease protein [Pedobacter caeni]
MNTEYFIAGRIAIKSERTFSKLIVRIAIAGVMLSLAVMILSVGIINGFKTEIQEKVRGYLGDVRIFKFDLNNSFEMTPFVPEAETINGLKNNKDVEYYQPYATKPAIISVNDEVEGVNFKGIDKTFNWKYISEHLLTGRVINFTDSAQAMKEIMISQFTANRLKLKSGDSFIMNFVQNPPRSRKFTVVGIYSVGVEEIDKGFVLGDLNVIRRLNNWSPDEIGAIEIRIKDFAKLKLVAADLYKDLEVNLKSESVSEFFPAIFTWLSLLDVNTRVLLILMMIVGVINMITALLIMILERTNMIGMLKAFGMTDFGVMKIFLYNAIYLVGIGLLLGNLLGLGLAFLQQYTHLFKLDQGSYYLSYVPIQLHFSEVLLLNICTVLICFVVLTLPSLLVSKISPLKAIRFK